MTEENLQSYLQQILDELRAIRRLLEQGGATPQEPSPAEMSETRSTPQTRAALPTELSSLVAEQFLCRYLRGRELTLVEADDLTPSNPTIRERMHLAYFIGEHYALARGMLGELRATLQSPRTIILGTQGLGERELCTLTNIATRLHNLHMLESYQYQRHSKRLVMRVRRQPYAHNYLSGEWFEWYVAQAVRKILDDQAPLVLRNVKLQTTSGILCEVDVLFVVQRGNELDIGVLECKSANAVYGDEFAQIKRMASLLNRGMLRTAVVMPDAPSPAFADQWTEQCGAQFIGRSALEPFLRELAR